MSGPGGARSERRARPEAPRRPWRCAVAVLVLLTAAISARAGPILADHDGAAAEGSGTESGGKSEPYRSDDFASATAGTRPEAAFVPPLEAAPADPPGEQLREVLHKIAVIHHRALPNAKAAAAPLRHGPGSADADDEGEEDGPAFSLREWLLDSETLGWALEHLVSVDVAE